MSTKYLLRFVMANDSLFLKSPGQGKNRSIHCLVLSKKRVLEHFLYSMVIHCDTCGKSVSDRFQKCPFCTVSLQSRREQRSLNHYSSESRFEGLMPVFRRKTIAL